MASKPILYSYFRSSCSWRVRIVLALKGIEYEYRAVNLLKGEQIQDKYKSMNPLGQVPSIEIDGISICQSIPIMEYLDETRGGLLSILPKDPKTKCIVRQVSEMINAGIQPIQNLTVLKYVGAEKKVEWAHKFITDGFVALEKVLGQTSGKYCVGDEVTMADACLVPQVYNAGRFNVDMVPFPVITSVNAALIELDAFIAADPSKMPDFPDDLK